MDNYRELYIREGTSYAGTFTVNVYVQDSRDNSKITTYTWTFTILPTPLQATDQVGSTNDIEELLALESAPGSVIPIITDISTYGIVTINAKYLL